MNHPNKPQRTVGALVTETEWSLRLDEIQRASGNTGEPWSAQFLREATSTTYVADVEQAVNRFLAAKCRLAATKEGT